jgi:AmmeMemoRadiSam system protein B/AmmeMemoRadiSam system protein A
MTRVRPAAVADAFYPGDASALGANVRTLLERVNERGPAPKALIAPHAGYVYSGAIAASVYGRLREAHATIRRVVLLGPCHQLALRGLAAPSVDAFETPLGPITIDIKARARIAGLAQVSIDDAPHAQEHSIEVQLPFLQEVLDNFVLLPLAVGRATADEVAEVIEALWGGEETVIVISSDLSHYHDYDTARRMDAATSSAIERLCIQDIGREAACGRVPIYGLLAVARQRGLSAKTIDLRNSGDTAGPRDRVVGYGAYVFASTERTDAKAERISCLEPGDTEGLLARYGEALANLAWLSLEHGVREGRALSVALEETPAELGTHGASFVTLERDGNLRGCIGSAQAWQPLVTDVAENAFRAGFEDPRFAPLTADELAGLDLSVSVLSPPVRFAVESEAALIAGLTPGVDGLILRDDKKTGLFLPQVWETLPEPEAFVRRLKLKAGLAADHWSGTMEVWRFASTSVHRAVKD